MWILSLTNTLGVSESYFDCIDEAKQSLHQARLNGCNGFIYLDKKEK